MITLLPQFQNRISVRFLTKTDDRTVPDPHVRLWQVHGNRTIVAREPSDAAEKADGAITDVRGLHLTIRAADCQNFAIYAPDRHIAGVLHVGWRGIVADAIGAFFAELQSVFDISATETWVAAGPSLCLKCAEYADPAFELRRKIDARYVRDGHIDLRAAANDQLRRAGVPPNRYERHEDCTCCHPDRYHTYRGGDRASVESGVSNILVCTLL